MEGVSMAVTSSIVPSTAWSTCFAGGVMWCIEFVEGREGGLG